MDVHKWYLFTCQLFSTVFDVAYTMFFLPVLFFPVPMGYTASRLSDALSISAFGGFCVSAAILGCLSAMIFNLFTYRLNVVLPQAHVLSLSKLGHIYLSVGVATFCLICVAVALIGTSADQTEAKLWAAEKYSCAEPAFSIPRLYIFELTNMKRVVVFAVGGDILFTCLSVACVALSFYFLANNGLLSPKTKLMQRRFLVYLCIQASVPTIGLTIPILLILYSMVAAVDIGQGFANLQMFILGLHGMITSITVLVCNEPYRTFALSFLTRRWWNNKK
ncbi:hypothetical protein Q1695_011537 [Nippostrongylus brasiliensis]|nr:hypothetical protein Q1695_011537 [Nippostrongylus brasiliensis]